MIPFLDLKAQYAALKPEIDQVVADVFASSQFALGKYVTDFETAFADFCDTHHCAGVNSGSSALHLALLACDIQPGDEVIVPSMTFVATAAAVVYTGAVPVFVDSDPATRNIDPAKIEAAITDRTKAIVPVHLHGLVCDMDPIMDIANRHGLKVVEDAAQAHGALYKGNKAGSIGDFGCFSFYPGKNLGAYGEGGAVVSNSADGIQKIKQLRDWGQAKKYEHVALGYNYRMDGVQGGILGVKLPHLTGWNAGRNRVGKAYTDLLLKAGFSVSPEPEGYYNVFHVFAVQVANRDAVMTHLQSRDIACGIHYPIPVHQQPAFVKYATGADCPVAEALGTTFVSLPIFPEMTDDQISEAAAAFLEIAEPSNN